MFGGSDVRIEEHRIQGIGDGFMPQDRRDEEVEKGLNHRQ